MDALLVKLPLKVIPNSSRTQVVGWLGEALKIKVAAVPESGKANKAVEALLAKTLALPAASVTICTGTTSQLKVLQITGLSQAEVLARINQQLS